MRDLEGKTAFITGGASGIGLGIAKTLAGAGMRVVIADLRQDHLDAAVAWFESVQKARDVLAIRLDVTDRPGFKAAADAAEAQFGPIHVLVNNAGVGIEGPLLEATYDDWDWGLGVNIGGVVNGIRTLLPRMVAHGQGGHVVNTASMAAVTRARQNFGIYAATKAAILALSESLQAELAETGIGVSVLCPGPYKTNIREAKLNRPEKFAGETGFGASLEKLSKREDASNWTDPLDAGERVLNAIREDQLYILTHGEFKPFAEAHYKGILDAFPAEPTMDSMEETMQVFGIK